MAQSPSLDTNYISTQTLTSTRHNILTWASLAHQRFWTWLGVRRLNLTHTNKPREEELVLFLTGDHNSHSGLRIMTIDLALGPDVVNISSRGLLVCVKFSLLTPNHGPKPKS
jgi:hypothetical protein